MIRFACLCLLVAGIYAASAHAWYHGWKGHVPHGCAQLEPKALDAQQGTVVHGSWVALEPYEVLLLCEGTHSS